MKGIDTQATAPSRETTKVKLLGLKRYINVVAKTMVETLQIGTAQAPMPQTKKANVINGPEATKPKKAKPPK